MAGTKLTEGCITAMMQGETVSKPILQVTNIRPISSASGPQRYRLLMSDGVNTLSSFMLATQLNSLVEDNRLASNCICQVNRFIMNTLKDGRRVVVVVELEVLKSADLVGGKIGNPIPYNEGQGPQPAAPAAPAAVPAVNKPFQQNGTPSAAGETSPPGQQTGLTFIGEKDDYPTINHDELQNPLDSFSIPSTEGGQPSSIAATPPPAETNQQQAPPTTAGSQDLENPHQAFQRGVLEVQREMADQVRVGFERLAAKLDAIHLCLSPIRDNLQKIMDTLIPLDTLQRSMADLAGGMIQTPQLSGQSGFSNVSQGLGNICQIIESMEQMQAQQMAVRAAHQRNEAGIYHALHLLITALLPQGPAPMNAAAASTSSSPPPDVSVPHSAAPTIPPSTCEAHDRSEEEEEDAGAFVLNRKQ